MNGMLSIMQIHTYIVLSWVCICMGVCTRMHMQYGYEWMQDIQTDLTHNS